MVQGLLTNWHKSMPTLAQLAPYASGRLNASSVFNQNTSPPQLQGAC